MGRSGLWVAGSSAPGPGTTFTACVRFITGHIISAAFGIRIASTIATGSLCAIHGSTIGDSENSAIVILIVDASSVKCGNLAGAILTVSAGSIMVAILPTAHRIGAG